MEPVGHAAVRVGRQLVLAGEDDGDGEHGVAGVLLKPITLVTSCQTEKKLT